MKPGNVMIDCKGVAHLLDLGLARFLNDHSDQLTLKYDDKIVLGTADYVAPEQIENSHAVDTRADIYALGSTFYFLLAGHPPFPTGTVSQKLLWHRTKVPTPILEIRPDVPAGLAGILSKMMVKDPKERYQTPRAGHERPRAVDTRPGSPTATRGDASAECGGHDNATARRSGRGPRSGGCGRDDSVVEYCHPNLHPVESPVRAEGGRAKCNLR